MQPVVSKLTFHEAEIEEDKFWRNASPEFRLKELKRLRDSYRKFMGMDINARIEKVAVKKLISQQDV